MKTEFMVVSKRGETQCELQVGDVKQGQHFNYLGSFITDKGKCETNI